MFIYEDLKALEAEGRLIKVGLVGAGFMGRGIVEVLESAPGMKVVAIADVDIARAAACFDAVGVRTCREIRWSGAAPSRGIPGSVCMTNPWDIAGSALRGVDFARERVVTSNYRVLPEIDDLDFIVEATGNPAVGAEAAFHGIMKGKHVGMLNVETDVTVGYYLSLLARNSGVVYTVCTGDEPAAVKELIDFSRTLGFTLVACGKGKNNPLDVEATPGSLSMKAREMGLNPRILTEFVDGSKTMVEMACVANSAGLAIDIRNMHGPSAGVEELAGIFRAQERGGILRREGVVDYAIGNVAPGVFAVVRHERPIVADTLRYLKIGEGPEFLLYRPYHLTNVEVPISIALGYLYGKPSVATAEFPRTEVITIAKRNLMRGEYIDSIGGETVYGGIETYETARQENLLPLGLCEGARLTEDVEKGKAIARTQVELRESFLLNLRKIQDSFHAQN
jgi:predicted homoserine dehydrogenase-like protein